MIFETPTLAGLSVGHVVTPSRTEQTPVSFLFFHPKNVESLHTSIRYEVYRLTGHVIDRQGDNQLRVIMTAVYDDSQSPTMESAIRSVESAVAANHEMNRRVVSIAVNEILNAMSMHQFYLDDIANPVPTPLDRSQFADQTKGSKSLELPQVGFGF